MIHCLDPGGGLGRPVRRVDEAGGLASVLRHDEDDARTDPQNALGGTLDLVQVVFRQPVHEKLIRALDDDFALVDGRESRGLKPGGKALRIHQIPDVLEDDAPQVRRGGRRRQWFVLDVGHGQTLLFQNARGTEATGGRPVQNLNIC